MRKALSIVLLFLYHSLFSQPIFENDSSYIPYNRAIIFQIDSIFHLDNQSDFEYRVWVLPALSRKKSLFILSLKNKVWEMRFFDYGWKYTDTTKTVGEKFVSENNFQSNDLKKLVQRLERNNYLVIPQFYTLKDKNGNPANVVVYDGISYRFELISKKNKRFYDYHCPAINAKEYRYIVTFKQVVNIIKAIYEYCGIKDYRPC